MSAPTLPSRHLLADLLMTAATELTRPTAEPADVALHTALGEPVVQGRLYLGRAGLHVPPGMVSVAVGFNVAAWIGLPAHLPRFAQETFSDRTMVRSRRRVGLSKAARMWLCVPDRNNFQVILIPTEGGLFLVPVHEYPRRLQEVARVAH